MMHKTIIENFQPGDLIFGLKNHRLQIKPKIEKIFNVNKIFADQYNAILIARFCDGGDKNFTHNAELVSSLDTDEKNHLNYLLDVPIEKVRINNDTLPASGYGKIIKTLDMEQRRTRRACKAALLKPYITIHFLLDDIKPLHIFNRDGSLHESQDQSCLHDSYTSAEFRFLMQHFDLTHQVVFYFNQKSVNLFAWLEHHQAFCLFQHYMQSKQANLSYQKLETLFANDDQVYHFVAEKISSPPCPPPTPQKKARLITRIPPEGDFGSKKSLLHSHLYSPPRALYDPDASVAKRRKA